MRCVCARECAYPRVRVVCAVWATAARRTYRCGLQDQLILIDQSKEEQSERELCGVISNQHTWYSPRDPLRLIVNQTTHPVQNSQFFLNIVVFGRLRYDRPTRLRLVGATVQSVRRKSERASERTSVPSGGRRARITPPPLSSRADKKDRGWH